MCFLPAVLLLSEPHSEALTFRKKLKYRDISWYSLSFSVWFLIFVRYK